MSIKTRLERLEKLIPVNERPHALVIEEVPYNDPESRYRHEGKEITAEELERLKATHDVTHIRIVYVNEPGQYAQT